MFNEEDHRVEERFRPLRAASRSRLIVAFLLGPSLWLAAFAVGAVVIDRTNAIGFGLLIAVASFVGSFVVLSLLRRGRIREERRYADPA